MIVRVLILFILFITAFSLHATADLICESEAMPPSDAAQGFLGLVKLGILKGEITPEMLLNLSQGKRAVSPLQSVKKPENIDFVKAFRRVAPQVHESQWPQLVKELRTILSQLKIDQVNTSIAQEKTSSVFRWKELGHTTERKPEGIFVSREGKVFVLTRGGTDGATIHGLSGPSLEFISRYERTTSSPEFFETRAGEVLFAWLENSELKIINAETGVGMNLDGLQTAVKEVSGGPDAYRPLLFEDADGLKVAIVPDHPREKPTTSVFRACAIVDVKNKKSYRQRLPNGIVNFHRVGTDKVVAYGFGFRELGAKMEIFIRDLFTDKDILSREFAIEPGIQLEKKFPELFTHNGQLEVGIFSAGKRGVIFDRKAGNLRVFGDEKSELFNQIQFGESNSGRAVFTAPTIEVDGAHLYFGNVFGDLSNNWQRLTAENKDNNFANAQIITTPMGKYVFALEVDDGSIRNIRLASVDGGQVMKLPLPPEIKSSEGISNPIYNVAMGSVLVYVLDVSRTWRLFELIGRDSE